MAASRFRIVSSRTKKIGRMEFTVIQDVQTGVLYTYGETEYYEGGSIFSPLLDKDGKPVVKPLNYNE